MNPLKTIWLTTALAAALLAAPAFAQSPGGSSSMVSAERMARDANPADSAGYPQSMGGASVVEGQKAETTKDLGKMLSSKAPMLTNITPMSAVNIEVTKSDAQQMLNDWYLKGDAAKERGTAGTEIINQAIAGKQLVGKLSEPGRWVKPAQAAAQAQATNAGNAAAEVSRDQASSAIDFCAHYLHNFTADGGNKWNLLRNNIFVPMGILLLLPGALLTQLRAIMAAGNPVLGNVNPLEGIMRSVIAIFLIPGTYLVVNYSIDLSNSITYTINSEYFRLFGSDMYKDAICAEIRAFPVRGEQENRNALDLPVPQMTPLVNPTGLFAQFEGMMENKIEDPCSGLYQAPGGRADEAMSSSSIAARLGLNGSNAALTASWNILCAFQMAYLYYLWFVGPIAAGLWVWPMKQLRGALPSWVEGVITLAFWSLFWNTAILLIACFKGCGETGCVLMTALHFLATASVKHAFDFAGLVRAAGQEAANMAEKAMKSGGAGGGSGGGSGSGGCGASKGGGQSQGAGASTADGIGPLSSAGSHGSVAALNTVGHAGQLSHNARVGDGGLNGNVALASVNRGDNSGNSGNSAGAERNSSKDVDGSVVPLSGGKNDTADLSVSSVLAGAPPLLPEAKNNDSELLASNLDSETAADVSLSTLSQTDTDWNTLVAQGTLNSVSDDSVNSGSDADLPPSATSEQAKQDATKDLVAAQQVEQRALAADAQAQQRDALEARRADALESKRAEALAQAMNNPAAQDAAEKLQAEARERATAESINQHLNNLASSLTAVNNAGDNVLGGGLPPLTMSRDELANFDMTTASTDVSNVSSNNVANAMNVSNDSLTYGQFARVEMSDIDILGSVESIDASVGIDSSVASVNYDSSVASADNSVSAVSNFDSSVMSNQSFAAPAVGNVTQYGDVTTYGGSAPNGVDHLVDRSSLINANAYTAVDSYGSSNVHNTSALHATGGNTVDASSVFSNASYSAQAISHNPVVAAVENYNTNPAGVHATTGAQSINSDYYAAPATSENVIASAQSTSSYSADYSTQSNAVASNAYLADYSTQSNAVASNAYSTQSNSVASTAYSAGSLSSAAPVNSSSYSVDYSQATQASAPAQQVTPVFASVLPTNAVESSAPTQSAGSIHSSNHSAGNVEFYSAQPAPSSSSVVSNASSYAEYSSSNSATSHYASAPAQYVSAPAQYESAASAPAQYASVPAQYASTTEQYAALSTQYAPVQGQPSSFIQPGAQANEYYAAPIQSAPLVAALITPMQTSATEIASVHAPQQSYSSPIEYYLANANTQAETRSVQNIAPIERAPQQSSDVVYSRSNSDAYTTVAPYHQVENTESRAVSFAPAYTHNVQHGPHSVVQDEAVVSQQQIHSKVQQAQGMLTRMNTILAGFDAPHAAATTAATVNKPVEVVQLMAQTPTKKSLSDLLPVQRAAKSKSKDVEPVAPPPMMSSSWFDA